MAPKKVPQSKAAQLRLLIKKRGSVIGAATSMEEFNANYKEEEANQLAIRITHLDELYIKFTNVEDEIEALGESEEGFSEERKNMQERYFRLKAELQQKLDQDVRPPAAPPARVAAHLETPNVRLPEINLEKFAGDYGKWESFRDLFTSLIHANGSLSAVQKLHYLRSSLSGEAARIISSLDISAANYPVAWRLLKERYENSNFLIKNHIASLLATPPVKKESSQKLAELADEFDRHVQLLDKLEDKGSHWNSFLVERLSQCLDTTSLREWETSNAGDGRPTYKELLEFIHKRARIIQTISLASTSQPEGPKPPRQRQTAAHVVAENGPRCVCCKKAHFLHQCTQFMSLTPRQRFELVKNNGLCINCMKGKHFSKDCSSSSCKSCSKKHHTLLHLSGNASPSDDQRPQPPVVQSQSCQLSQIESSVGSSAHEQPASSVASPLPIMRSFQPTSSATTSRSAPWEQFTSAANSSRSAQSEQSGLTAVISRSAHLEQSSLAAKSSRSAHSEQSGLSAKTSRSAHSEQPVQTSACQGAEVKHNSKDVVMLSTAVIKVVDSDNNYQYARALLDSGSQPNFITEALCQRLRLKRQKLNAPVSGIGQSTVNVHYGVTLSFASRFGEFDASVQCLVLPKLTISLPGHHVDVTRWQIPRHIPLADPQFNISQGVDVILGAEMFFELLQQQRIALAPGYPALQKTVLGFVVCGKVSKPKSSPVTLASNVCTDDALDAQLERFWEIEAFENGKALTTEETICEEHFQQTSSRDSQGRYIVRLPMRTEMLHMLGDSYDVALRRFKSMERKFQTDESLRKAYADFMNDYEKLGHMEVASSESSSPQFFLPHHAIHRPESSTTKIRVVFDGSCRGSTHLCLNDLLYTGHTVQPTLFSIVINFRMPRFVVTADVEKMFRQIWIHPDDRKFQKILWRASPLEPIRTYTLNTVTYGLASSPFHATRVLEQLALDEGDKYPVAKEMIQKGTYMDDVLSGHNDRHVLEQGCRELREMLMNAGFVLRKFASNEPSVLASIPPEFLETDNVLELDRTAAIKTLGLLWFPRNDGLRFKVPTLEDTSKITKRIVVSEMAQLFDPLGLLSPVIMRAKMFVQTLWTASLSWDIELQDEYSCWWNQYRAELPCVLKIEIPRRVIGNSREQYSLHCFCDASKNGYGCCVYVVSEDESGVLQSRLLTSKSRVASLKAQSIPRYELCAALLGSQLIDTLHNTTCYTQPATFWSDSTIVLHWIKSPSHKWKVFVSNRIAEIQRLTKGSKWRHVPTELNPADKVSRGMPANEIAQDNLWWHGPEFLTSPVDQWPESIVSIEGASEVDCEAQLVALPTCQIEASFFDNPSELAKLLKSVAFCYRIFNNCRQSKSQRSTSNLTPEEYNHALKIVIRLAQRTSFPLEMRLYDPTAISSASPPRIGSKSSLKNLNLFIDEFGLLRLDSRLKNRNAAYDTRYPILLPANHRLSWLIARSIHLQTFHGGPSLLLATIRQRFWPLQGRTLVRKVVRECITCFRCNPRPTTQQMAPLPAVRVTPAKVFGYTGLDYCGPFNVRPLSGRGSSIKMYVALFVCLAVKAVHLEVVADLTSTACINAIKRLVANQGRVYEIHCDNATAFVGADRELRALRQQFRQQFLTSDWQQYSLESGITFRFIPARSPHFGGLWEAGIKSFKYHFRRIVGQNSYNVDHFLTIVAQIQAILNSRPIASHPDHPEDLEPLTPGHFLIGEPLVSISEPDLTDLSPNRLSRLQGMKRSVQDLWKRWSRDYISQLHQRTKWKHPSANIRVGQLVLLNQDNSPPLHWPLGRVEKVFPGSDGRVRAVLVRTARGSYTRAITKVSILPIDPDEGELHMTSNVKDNNSM